MTIRHMKPSDFAEMYQLWQEAGLHVIPFKKEQQDVGIMLRKNPDGCLAVLEKDKIVGTVLGTWNGRRVWIYHLAIHPNFQKKGYGSVLIREVEKIYKKKGATRMLLFVDITNLKVVPFYEKNKFTVVQDSVLMGKFF